MKRLVLGISSFVFLLASSVHGNEIGFKGLYLNADKDKACKIVKKYADKYKQDYKMSMKKHYCYTNKSKPGNYLSNFQPINNFFIVRFDKNNKVKKIEVDSFWTDILFESSNLRQRELARELLDNLDWMTELSVETQNFFGNKIYHYVQKTRSWKFKISPSKKIELTKLKVKNFN